MLSYDIMPNKITPVCFTKRVIVSSAQAFYKSLKFVLDRLFVLFNKILSPKTHDNIAGV